MAILEDTFKSNEGDRKKQIQGLKERIKDQEEKIARCDDMLLNREIDRESHQRMILKIERGDCYFEEEDRIARKQRNRIYEVLPIWHSSFEQFEWFLHERFD